MSETQKLARRKFVTLGATGVATIALGNLIGCGERVDGSAGNSSAPQDTTALDQAKADWEAEYQRGDDDWLALQYSISLAESNIFEFEETGVKDPATLDAYKETLGAAKAVKNQHSNIKMPETIEEIEASITELEKITDGYSDNADDLSAALSKIEKIVVGVGAFDIVDRDGYSYNISYSMTPTISVDTSEGKPGYVGLYMDFSNCSVSIKNTTSGKKAPGLMLSCMPLYALDQFSDAIITEHPEYTFATFAMLANPTKFSVLEDYHAEEYKTSPQYINPFDNDSDNRSEFSGLAERMYLEIRAGVVASSYGNERLWTGEDLEVGETRSLGLANELRVLEDKNINVGEVSESYVERFRNIVGWAVNVNSSKNSIFVAHDDQLIYMFGKTNVSSDLSDTRLLYAHNPVA